VNSEFPKGKLSLVVAAAVATAALERHGRNWHYRPEADHPRLPPNCSLRGL